MWPTDYIRYTHPITKEKMYKSFALTETYYALVNTDGTIRGNKLFKGANFSEITEIIDLKAYSSLREFKEIRIKELYQIRGNNKQDITLN